MMHVNIFFPPPCEFLEDTPAVYVARATPRTVFATNREPQPIYVGQVQSLCFRLDECLSASRQTTAFNRFPRFNCCLTFCSVVYKRQPVESGQESYEHMDAMETLSMMLEDESSQIFLEKFSPP